METGIKLDAPYLYNAISEVYNVWAIENNKKQFDYEGGDIHTTRCTVVGFLSKTYGKYPKNDIEATMIMEYDTLLNFTVKKLNPAAPQDFLDYVYERPLLIDEYADLLMYTLPLPRYKWYEPSNFQVI
jgi:hypothetical protein